MSDYRQQVVDVIAPLNPKWGAEIGVASGSTSAMMLRACPNLNLYMIDPWGTIEHPESEPYWQSGDPMARATIPVRNEWMVTAAQKTAFAGDRAKMLVMTSAEALKRVPDGSLCCAFVDGQHTYVSARFDWEEWWKKIRPGGVLLGHDYGNNFSRPTEDVQPAVDDFVKKHGLELHVGIGFVAWVYKPEN